MNQRPEAGQREKSTCGAAGSQLPVCLGPRTEWWLGRSLLKGLERDSLTAVKHPLTTPGFGSGRTAEEENKLDTISQECLVLPGPCVAPGLRHHVPYPVKCSICLLLTFIVNVSASHVCCYL